MAAPDPIQKAAFGGQHPSFAHLVCLAQNRPVMAGDARHRGTRHIRRGWVRCPSMRASVRPCGCTDAGRHDILLLADSTSIGMRFRQQYEYQVADPDGMPYLT